MGKITIDELSNELKEYMNELGLSEEQVQALIDTGLVDLNNNLETLQSKVDNGQNHKLTNDNGTSISLSGANLNNITTSGNYVGNNWVNGPSQNYAIVEVTQGTSGIVKQIFTETTSTNQYLRIYRSSTWTDWRSL